MPTRWSKKRSEIVLEPFAANSSKRFYSVDLNLWQSFTKAGIQRTTAPGRFRAMGLATSTSNRWSAGSLSTRTRHCAELVTAELGCSSGDLLHDKDGGTRRAGFAISIPVIRVMDRQRGISFDPTLAELCGWTSRNPSGCGGTNFVDIQACRSHLGMSSRLFAIRRLLCESPHPQRHVWCRPLRMCGAAFSRIDVLLRRSPANGNVKSAAKIRQLDPLQTPDTFTIPRPALSTYPFDGTHRTPQPTAWSTMRTSPWSGNLRPMPRRGRGERLPFGECSLTVVLYDTDLAPNLRRSVSQCIEGLFGV